MDGKHHMTPAYWAIVPDALVEVRARRPDRRVTAAAPTRNRSVGSGVVAALPLFGVLSQHPAWWADVPLELWGRAFDALLADPSVKAIVLDVNSPGGEVAGVEKVAQKIFDARPVKTIIAHANSMMASAAYYLASQAHEVIADPGALVGSIGVIWQHVDFSEALHQAGLNVTTLTAGKYKSNGIPEAPLSEDARLEMQRIVDSYYSQFVAAVARGRAASTGAVRGGYGQGRVLSAPDAKAAGLVDRIDTMEGTMQRLAGRVTGIAAGSRHPGIDARRRRLRWASVEVD